MERYIGIKCGCVSNDKDELQVAMYTYQRLFSREEATSERLKGPSGEMSENLRVEADRPNM